MRDSLQGKVAIITGGNSGIGKATALLFATEGANTIVSARCVEGGEATVNGILKSGGVATFVQADVPKSTDVKELVDKAVSLYGTIDCLFNNAGISGNPGTPITELDEAEWGAGMGVDVGNGVRSDATYAAVRKAVN